MTSLALYKNFQGVQTILFEQTMASLKISCRQRVHLMGPEFVEDLNLYAPVSDEVLPWLVENEHVNPDW